MSVNAGDRSVDHRASQVGIIGDGLKHALGHVRLDPAAEALNTVALDGFGRVIRTGSFSKTLSASIRCGYVAAHPDYVSALRNLQVATGFGGPSSISWSACWATAPRRHLEAMRPRLAKARREVAAKLLALGIEPWIMPRGGFYLWCRFLPGIDAAALARTALREGMVLAPGNVFSLSQTATGFMRFNVAQMGEPRIFDVLTRALAQVSS